MFTARWVGEPETTLLTVAEAPWVGMEFLAAARSEMSSA